MTRIHCLLLAALVFLATDVASAAIKIDVTTSTDRAARSNTISTPVFSTAEANELLLAFVSTDTRGSTMSVTSMVGAGLTWVRVVRTNAQDGTAEIWRAFATAQLTGVSVRATLSTSVAASITVVAFTGTDPAGVNGAGAIGAIGSASAGSGAPRATLVTTRDNSWVFGVGADNEDDRARVVGPGQTMVHEYFADNVTYWVQRQNNPTPLRGTSVTINDTSPTNDAYNLSICEILPAPAATDTWNISGTLSPAVAGGGATVTVAELGLTTTADGAGNFSFAGVPDGTYTLTPSKSGFTFTPASRSVTIAGADAAGVSFTAQAVITTWDIAGTVTPGADGSGTLLTISELGRTATADGAGSFSFADLPNGTYTLTPSKSGFTFTPASRSVTIAGADAAGVSFTAQAVITTWDIAGTVTPGADGSGTLLSISELGRTTTADATGNFTFADLPNGTYTLTPSKSDFTFTPASRSVTIAGADASAVSFTAQAVITTWDIAGTVTPGAAGSGTLLTISELGRTATADAAGNFSFADLPNGTYTLTPSKSGFTFTPASRSVTIAGADVTGVSFTAQAVITTWDIAGTVTPGADGSGTLLTISELGRTATADAAGSFSFADLPNGTYTLTPSKTGFAFSPASRSVTVNGSDTVGLVFSATRLSTAAVVGQWAAPFDLGIVAVNTVMMHTGKVLMYSGSFTTSAVERVWDPATGGITLVPNPFYNLFCSGHSQLADGRILVVGGYDNNSLGAANANIFDPVSLSWTALPNMTYRRWYPTSTTLPDGRALITSGAQSCLTCLADVPEIFDPATNRFSTLPSARLGVPYYPFMYVLPDGRVIDAGSNEKPAATRTLDMATGTWTTVDPIVRDGHSSAMYQPGKILKTGTAADSGQTGNAAATAFVLDMTQPAPAWRQVASMAFRRAFHNTTLLPDGTVLVTGGGSMKDGYDTSNSAFSAELWSPSTETWQTLAAATVPRLYHSTALLLPDGRVMTSGSGNDGPAIDQRRAEIFSPPYLFKGARPTITSAPDTIQYGASFALSSPDAADIASVTLIRPGAVTHGFDADQRLVNLAFTASGATLTIQTPASANLAPPGYYMLFLVNSNGVPSIATFVRFAPPGADADAPAPPTDLSGDGAIATATLTWTASTDNTGVALYNVHRSTTSGFAPALTNRIAQPTSTSFTDNGVTAGTYFYVVTAQDVAGNVSAPSNESSVVVLADTTAPLVSIAAPPDQATVSGSVLVSATASDDVGIAGVQFKLDGNVLGAERTAAPYSVPWNSATTSNGSHTLTAVARDASGNLSEASVDVVVSNTSQTPNGLVAAFAFSEGSGVQVIDASGQGNTGTISSATWNAAGKYGPALSFNGTSAWVTVADSGSLDLTAGMTIEAWVNPTAGTAWRTVVLKESAGGLVYSLYSANGASRPAGYVHVASDRAVNGTAAVPLNTWTHVAVTYDGTTMRLFVNGLQVQTSVVGGPMTPSGQPLRIGGNSVWGEYFRGLIDEVRIYNRPLTAAEIQIDMITPIL